MNFHSQNKGFTLIEVMIAMVILAMISLGIFQATVETFKLRDTLMHEGNFHNSIRLAMNIVERDLLMAYSPIQLVPPKKKTQAPSQNPGSFQEVNPNIAAGTDFDGADRSFKFWGPALHQSGIRPARFKGNDTSFTFISLSHVRVYRDKKESEFAKITYEIRPIKDAPKNVPPRQLVKIENVNAFNLEDGQDQFDRVYSLIPGIEKIKIRYYRKSKDAWTNDWDSDSPDSKNMFPDTVEIQMQVKGEYRLIFDGLFKYKAEVPLSGLPEKF